MKGKTVFLAALALIVYAAATWVGYRYIWLPVFPGESRLIIQDDAGTLGHEQVEFIDQYHRQLISDHDIDYRSVILNDDIGDINMFAYKYFTEQQVGRLSQSGRGLLLVIDTYQDLVRLEVSQSLEGIYTDAFVSYVQHRQMVPFFQSGRVADGILASTELIVSRAQQAASGQAFVPPMVAKSAGAGAVNPARIGAGEDGSFRDGTAVVDTSANDPRSVLAAYREVMKQRNGSPELNIYTEETRAFLRQWTVTPAQMDNEARNIERCPTGALKLRADHAVIRFPVFSRQCPPYFFKVEDAKWRLDLTMMSKAIRFNHRNQWHFDTKYPLDSEPYSFAFSDWQLDKNGFPWKAEHASAAAKRN